MNRLVMTLRAGRCDESGDAPPGDAPKITRQAARTVAARAVTVVAFILTFTATARADVVADLLWRAGEHHARYGNLDRAADACTVLAEYLATQLHADVEAATAGECVRAFDASMAYHERQGNEHRALECREWAIQTLELHLERAPGDSWLAPPVGAPASAWSLGSPPTRVALAWHALAMSWRDAGEHGRALQALDRALEIGCSASLPPSECLSWRLSAVEIRRRHVQAQGGDVARDARGRAMLRETWEAPEFTRLPESLLAGHALALSYFQAGDWASFEATTDEVWTRGTWLMRSHCNAGEGMRPAIAERCVQLVTLLADRAASAGDDAAAHRLYERIADDFGLYLPERRAPREAAPADADLSS